MKNIGPVQDNLEPASARGSSLYSSPSRDANSLRGPSASSGLDLPRMGAEVGFQVVNDDDVPPFRASGLVSLLLGLLSASALIAWQMLVLPIAAILFGVFALRKWTGPRPAGTTAAVIGLLLASCFGAGGLAIPLAKRATVGKQAEFFARQYLELIGNGDVELASELRKEARNRQVASMNLKELYRKEALAKSETEPEENRNSEQDAIQLAGPNIPWELVERPRVYSYYGMERVETIWFDPSGKLTEKVVIELQWSPDDKNNIGNWHVNNFHFYRDLIYAPSVL